MIRRPPRSTRTDTLFPYPTLFRSLAVSVDKTVVHGNDFQTVEFGLGHDGRAECHVRRADNKPLGAVSGEAVDGREGLLAVGHGDLDHSEAPVLTGLFGERPFCLEPGLLGHIGRESCWERVCQYE